MFLAKRCGKLKLQLPAAHRAEAEAEVLWKKTDGPLANCPLLGRGKGGYTWLAERGGTRYALKQIHHEPCDYYQFGDKMAAELRDYQTLSALGVPIPRLLEAESAPLQVSMLSGIGVQLRGAGPVPRPPVLKAPLVPAGYACVILPGTVNPLPALFDGRLIEFLRRGRGTRRRFSPR